jgi:hypothetical protein
MLNNVVRLDQKASTTFALKSSKIHPAKITTPNKTKNFARNINFENNTINNVFSMFSPFCFSNKVITVFIEKASVFV